LVLTNDAAAANAIVAELSDPELSRAAELLQQGKAESAEQVFQSLLKQKRHEQNLHLALQIGELLYEAKRLPALQKLTEDQCDRLPHDARKFNLLGLALLEGEPRQAVDAFKNALRCDLRFESAYLNLAQAYQLANDPQSARMCLQRYLAFIPGGVYAADARRRLAGVDTTGK
jgi:predicted Zn-dependent protease